MFILAYAEAVKVSKPFNAARVTPILQEPAAPSSHRASYVAPTGPVEPSAPYPALSYVDEQ